MAESLIVHILCEKNSKSRNATATNFQKLCSDSVQTVAKNIGNILYDSLSRKSNLSDNTRLDILALLRRWSTVSQSNLSIDRNNYDCLIEFLESSIKTSKDDDLEALLKLNSSSSNDWDSNITTSVITFCKKREAVKKRKAAVLNSILTRDYNKCGGKSAFKITPCGISTHCNLTGLFHYFQLLNIEDHCAVLQKSTNSSEGKLLNSDLGTMREQQIGLGYSLLNLSTTISNSRLLSEVLTNLSSYEVLEFYEQDFIEYLWKKCAGKEKVLLQLLEKFPFIYEKTFIKLCTTSLKATSASHSPVISDDIHRILDLSKENNTLCCNIRKLLYELYVYSGCNNKLWSIINLIK